MQMRINVPEVTFFPPSTFLFLLVGPSVSSPKTLEGLNHSSRPIINPPQLRGRSEEPLDYILILQEMVAFKAANIFRHVHTKNETPAVDHRGARTLGAAGDCFSMCWGWRGDVNAC